MTRFARLHWQRVLVSSALLFVLFGNQGFRGLLRNWMELRHLRREIAALEAQEAVEAGRIKALGSGDASFERMARKELGFIRQGEIEYRFPAPSVDEQ